MRLHGTLRLPLDSALTGSEVAWVRLLDVSRADASAVPVASTSVPLTGGAETVEVDFDFEATALDPRSTYTIAAHVDMSGSGDITPGDLLTTRHIDVSPTAIDRSYDVPLDTVT